MTLLYASLSIDSYLSVWTIGLFIDCVYLLAIFLPGAVITTKIKKILKITNKIRAITDPEDKKSIRQLESFLIYLYTNSASFKVVGKYFLKK